MADYPSPSEIDWAAVPAQLTTQEAAQVLRIRDSHVRALVSDRKKRAESGAEVTDADGLPAPQESSDGKKRFHQRDSLRRFLEAQEAQKARTIQIERALPVRVNAAAEPDVMPPALAALQRLPEVLDKLSAGQGQTLEEIKGLRQDFGQVANALNRLAEAQEKANQLTAEKQQKERRWWQFWR